MRIKNQLSPEKGWLVAVSEIYQATDVWRVDEYKIIILRPIPELSFLSEDSLACE